jgi:hypothetical protein
MCRKQHGSLFATGLGVERDRCEWLAGTGEVVHYRASSAFERAFCGQCGSKVPSASHLPDVMLVPAGALDDDFDMAPRAHIFVGSKSPLTALSDSLPKFAAYPPGVDLQPVLRRSPESAPGTVNGSCLCGAVAYEIDGRPRRLVHCHCSLCRRSRGAPHSTTLFAPPERFRWIRGAEAIDSYRLPLPRIYGTNFCEHCGSLVPMEVTAYNVVILPAGSVDTPLEPLPGAHIFVGSKARWETIGDDLPQFDELPPPEQFSDYFG